MPWHIPQYIGKSEIENSLKMRGYLMPDDEEAHEYYSNRRLEANAVEVWGCTAMYKSGSISEGSSPSRTASRSKLLAMLSKVPLSCTAKVSGGVN